MTYEELKQYSGTELIEMIQELEESLENMEKLLDKATSQATLNKQAGDAIANQNCIDDMYEQCGM